MIILDQTGCRVKELNFTPARLIGLALLSAVLIGLITLAVFDYNRLKKSLPLVRGTHHSLSLQADKIVSQRRQIQFLANDIKSLQKKWTELRHLETKIKDLAGLERIDEASSPYGIGGSATDDQDIDHKNRTPASSR